MVAIKVNKLVLVRGEGDSDFQRGELTYKGKFVAHSMERGWNANRPFVSCLPKGLYALVPYIYKQGQSGEVVTFVLVNNVIGITAKKESGNKSVRYSCCLHYANWAEQLQGCISFGGSVSNMKSKPSVSGSKKATNKVLRLIHAQNITHLEIV